MKIDTGRLLQGNEAVLGPALEAFGRIPVDLDLCAEPFDTPRRRQTTIAQPVTLSGKGTFSNKTVSTITFEPTQREGWFLDRSDLPDSLPIRVAIDNVWTTGAIVSNIVLRAGNPHNYVRMVEHIIALRAGLDVDNLLIRIDSGDPPLFNRGSLDLIEALDRAGRQTLDRPVRHVTVKEPVTVCSDNGSFLTLAPHRTPDPRLLIDAAVDFPNAIGTQRIRYPLTPKHLRIGGEARTNTPYAKMLYCKTIGKVFADIRHLGYTQENILIARKTRYHNTPRLVQENGKSLEAAWHRAALDLPAALALLPDAHFCGEVISYKAGHRLDCEMITRLFLDDCLVPVEPAQ